MSARFLPRAIISRLVVALVFALMAGGAHAQAFSGTEKVTLQLKWKHQFQFAGYYAALEKGYFRDAGFDVVIAEAQGGEDTIQTVLSGKAQYGVATSELAQRRGLGEPVVALATILQHSALALAAGGSSNLTVHDLDGKRIMVTPHDTEIFAYLQREGLPATRVLHVRQSFNLADLIERRVDGFSIYTTDQVWALREARFVHTILSPRSAGIDFYGDTLFTSEAQVQRGRERVAAFREASLRGWRYAMANPAETADLILAKYSNRLPREHLLFEAAEMRRLMQPELIEIGHMNPGRWRHIADVYAELRMLPAGYSLEGLVFDSTLRSDIARAYRWMAAAAVAALLIGLLAAWQLRLIRALRKEMRSREQSEAQLRRAEQLLEARLAEIHELNAQMQRQTRAD